MASETNSAPKPKERRLGWSEASEAALLELWPDRVEQLRGQRKNGHVYAEMADELGKMGYPYNARDVQIKIQNFTQRYRKEKAGVGVSGGSPSTWPLYNRVHQIIGGFKANLFNELVIESIYDDSITPTNSNSPSTPAAASSPLPPLSASSLVAVNKKQKRFEFKAAVLQNMQDLSTDIRTHLQNSEENEKKMKEIESKKEASLAKIAEDNNELKNALIAFINKN